MCKTSFKVVVFYDGTRSAKEVLNDAIASKVRRMCPVSKFKNIDAWLNLSNNLVTERSAYYADSSNERFKKYGRNRAQMC